jgi:hypothetical protein
VLELGEKKRQQQKLHGQKQLQKSERKAMKQSSKPPNPPDAGRGTSQNMSMYVKVNLTWEIGSGSDMRAS